MADPNIGQLAASTLEAQSSSDPADNTFTSQWLLFNLKQSKSFTGYDGGRLIEESLEYAQNTTFHSYADMGTLDTSRIDVFDAARFDWKEVHGTIVFSLREKLMCRGKYEKIDLVTRKVDNGKNSGMEEINRQLFLDGTGNGGLDIAGLALLISSTPSTGVVGGINRATFAFWRNFQVSGAKTSTAFDNLRNAWTTAYNSASKGAFAEHPEWGVTDQTSFQGYESQLVLLERIVDKNSADLGFKNEVLKFKGAKVAYDEKCPAGTTYWGNSRNLKLNYLKGAWMKPMSPVEPGNQMAEIIRVATIANTSINNSRRLAVVTGIN